LTDSVIVRNIIPVGQSKKRPNPGRPRKTQNALAEWIDLSEATRKEVAEELGITRTSLDRLCRGARRPSLELAFTIERLSDGLVPVSVWADVPPHCTKEERKKAAKKKTTTAKKKVAKKKRSSR